MFAHSLWLFGDGIISGRGPVLTPSLIAQHRRLLNDLRQHRREISVEIQIPAILRCNRMLSFYSKETINVATPYSRVADPIGVKPSKNVTTPVGRSESPGGATTTATKVTVCPTFDGLEYELRRVADTLMDGVTLTVWMASSRLK